MIPRRHLLRHPIVKIRIVIQFVVFFHDEIQKIVRHVPPRAQDPFRIDLHSPVAFRPGGAVQPRHRILLVAAMNLNMIMRNILAGYVRDRHDQDRSPRVQMGIIVEDNGGAGLRRVLSVVDQCLHDLTEVIPPHPRQAPSSAQALSLGARAAISLNLARLGRTSPTVAACSGSGTNSSATPAPGESLACLARFHDLAEVRLQERERDLVIARSPLPGRLLVCHFAKLPGAKLPVGRKDRRE